MLVIILIVTRNLKGFRVQLRARIFPILIHITGIAPGQLQRHLAIESMLLSHILILKIHITGMFFKKAYLVISSCIFVSFFFL